MRDSLTQTNLNAHLNDALAAFVADGDIDFETAMAAIEDLKTDAPLCA